MKQHFRQFLLPALSLLLLSLVACAKTGDLPAITENTSIDPTVVNQINAFPQEPLSNEERTMLIHMREEEKLARDVYAALYDKWGMRSFININSSEQMHMDAVHTLLNKYNIADPVQQNPQGVFSDAGLQALYHTLIARGMKSVQEAFTVGATIEDLDLLDLENAMKEADNQDINWVYSNLARGSRNHLRAFYQNLQKWGVDYLPQYITRAAFDAIVNSEKETGW